MNYHVADNYYPVKMFFGIENVMLSKTSYHLSSREGVAYVTDNRLVHVGSIHLSLTVWVHGLIHKRFIALQLDKVYKIIMQ